MCVKQRNDDDEEEDEDKKVHYDLESKKLLIKGKSSCTVL